jgi:hypothetical protein
VRLEPGKCEIRLLPRAMRGGELMKLRSLVLKPL